MVYTPLQNTLPFVGVGGLERQGAPVIIICLIKRLETKEKKSSTFTPLTSGPFPGGRAMANPGSDADSSVLAVGQANRLAVWDASRPVPVPPSASLADNQGLSAPVRQCKARLTSSLYMTDYHWMIIKKALE